MKDNSLQTGYFSQRAEVSEAVSNKMIRKVYLWMFGALVVTGFTAYHVAGSQQLMSLIFGNSIGIWVLIIAEFALVIGVTAAINKISAATATLLFILYSAVNGALFSSIFVVYEIGSITTTFFVTASLFAVMALYGAVTGKDLTKIGNLCLMAIVGLIIAIFVNYFLKNTMLDMIVSIVGVLIFVGLTAYDSQKIKNLLFNAEENETTTKIALLGALSLYLDFINLFLYLLRFLGKRD